MNVKFKMPKFTRHLTNKTFWKELLLTILATTISIILTFGTAHVIEKRQKEKAGRQAAMMVIHDMDQTAEDMHKRAKAEESYFNMAQYVINNFDRIDAISEDTLTTVFNYLLDYNFSPVNDSKEKIFHSSQDSWRNINNANFIDLVQEFYYNRRVYDDYFKNDIRFKAPISQEEQYQMMFHTPNYDLISNVKDNLKQIINKDEVQLYLIYSPARVRSYQLLADEWQRMSDKGKFILGITDKELDEYIEKNKHAGKLIKEKELVGKWTTKSDISTEEIEFLKDHTFVHQLSLHINNPFYTGSIISKNTFRGTWQIEDDSLIRTYSPIFDYDLDVSQITYTPAMKDSVESFIANNKKKAKELMEEAKNSPTERRQSEAVYLDNTGDKIEMNFQSELEEVGVSATYMVRVK